MISFKPVSLDEITKGDLTALAKAVESDPTKTRPEVVKASLLKGEFVLWRVSDGDKGIGVALVQDRPEDKEIFGWYSWGKGVVEHRAYLDSVLVEFAKVRGAKFIRFQALPSLVEMLEALGYKTELVCVVKEINDG